jgi:peptide/nickel transport system substrate-binding protein
VAIPWTPETLDPTMNLSSIRAAVWASMFDSLVGRDKDNRIVPQLAESWRLLDDRTCQFRLRRGVVFHYATRDRVTWTPRTDQWMLLHEASLK